MEDKQFVFAGNRAFVLELLLEEGHNLSHIFAVKDSYLQRYLEQANISFSLIESKAHLVKELDRQDFDFFISNGLPLILPISKLEDGRKKFVNVHPSYLPDLRGKDPVPGAILYKRDLGATCHIMTDEIDGGPIIFQQKIPFSEDWDAKLLYQLVFKTEKEVFEESLKLGLVPQKNQEKTGDEIEYAFDETDCRLDFDEPLSKFLARIKAFNTPSKGAYFVQDDNQFRVFGAKVIKDKSLCGILPDVGENEIALIYENVVVIKKEGCYIQLLEVEGNIGDLQKGKSLN